MIKEQEACQSEKGIQVGNRCYLKEVFAESYRTLLLCLELYCAPEEVPGCGAFLKKVFTFQGLRENYVYSHFKPVLCFFCVA